MASNSLNGLKVALLITDGFEQVEMTEPRKALDDAGAETKIVSPKEERVKAWRFTQWGDEFPVDLPLSSARAENFDALVLPGGVMNPEFVASICHGPWTVIEAGAARGRRMTSWPSLKTDLKNAGAEWVDQEVVVDQGLATSRKPDDIPAFNAAVIKLFAGARGR